MKDSTHLIYKFKKIKREKGYLYFVKSDDDGFLEVWKAKLNTGGRKKKFINDVSSAKENQVVIYDEAV